METPPIDGDPDNIRALQAIIDELKVQTELLAEAIETVGRDNASDVFLRIAATAHATAERTRAAASTDITQDEPKDAD